MENSVLKLDSVRALICILILITEEEKMQQYIQSLLIICSVMPTLSHFQQKSIYMVWFQNGATMRQ